MGITVLLGVLSGLLAQAKDADDASHFPLIPGSRWVYKTQALRWSTRVGEPGPGREGPLRTIFCSEGKEGPTLTSPDSAGVRMIVTRDGVYQNSVDAANLVLKFPLKKFDDWGPGDKKSGQPRFANHGQVDIEIGGIKYRSWKIVEQRVLPKGLRSWTRWYAPGIGLVQEEAIEEIDGTITKRSSVLESYEKGAGGK